MEILKKAEFSFGNRFAVMKKNVIILTSGMSGSSVLANLISQAGYWLGDETSKAPFETYENKELIDLRVRKEITCNEFVIVT